MTKRWGRLAAAMTALTALAYASQAGAIGTTYGATYSGTVKSGTDTYNLFGKGAGANLANLTWTETFLVNTLNGTKRFGSNQQDEVGSSGFITATLTINGHTVALDSSIYGEAFVNNGGSVTNSSSGIFATSAYNGTNAYHTVFDYVADSSFSVPNASATLASYANNSTAAFTGFPTQLDQAFSVPVGSNGTTGAGYFNIYNDCKEITESLNLSELIAGAPEPGTWALLMAGVGMLGAVLRTTRRRSSLMPS